MSDRDPKNGDAARPDPLRLLAAASQADAEYRAGQAARLAEQLAKHATKKNN
jgi:hypothetical protein